MKVTINYGAVISGMPADPNDLPEREFAVKCEHCGGGSVSTDDSLLRCVCGSLLARYRAGRLELKCRRCKRTLTIPLAELNDSGG
jgi:hypothetical protein